MQSGNKLTSISNLPVCVQAGATAASSSSRVGGCCAGLFCALHEVTGSAVIEIKMQHNGRNLVIEGILSKFLLLPY